MLELFNSIILILIIHTAIYRTLGYKTPGILFCGLFGYIGKRNNHNFNWDKFNHLGLDNDERGGDSVGRAVGDNIVKFVNNNKVKTTYQEYVINHKNDEPSHIAIGHTRKASVGVVNVTNAQPIVIDLPNNQKFVMVHNGTIYNWEDLAKSHGVESEGKTDSMVLAEIIVKDGYDVLREYNGAAALIIKDDRDADTLKVFKGQSKNYSSKLEEERPLFYYQENETSMYISSKEDGLYFIGGLPDNIVDFNSNMLYTIFEGQIINQEEYDRSDCSSCRIWPKTSNTNFYGTRYSAYDDYEDLRGRNEAVPYTNKPNMRKDTIPTSSDVRKIIQAKLRYWFCKSGSSPYYANGIITLDEEGQLWGKTSKSLGKEYYFYAGIMLKDSKSYYEVKEKFGKARHFIDNDVNISEMCKYSVYPVCTIDSQLPAYGNIKSHEYKLGINGQKPYWITSFYTGTIEPLFSYKRYHVYSGDLASTFFNKDAKTPNHSIISTQTPALQSEFKPIDINLKDGISSDVSRELAEKAVNSAIEVVGFAGNNDKSPFKTPYKKALEEIYEDIEDADYDLKNDFPVEDDDTIDDDDIDDYDDWESSDYVSKVISLGIDQILKSIDEVIQEIEMLGVSGENVSNALSNFYKLQDPFMNIKEFKKKPLIISYDDQF